MNWLLFIGTLFAGALIGFAICALITVSGRSNDAAEIYYDYDRIKKLYEEQRIQNQQLLDVLRKEDDCK